MSFDRPGYIKTKATSPNNFVVSLKFKTIEKDGLIFYATNEEQSAGISLSMHNGSLTLISQKLETSTSPLSKYNDNEWHVVTVMHNNEELRLDIDDWDHHVTDSAPPRLDFMYGDIYVGGLPQGFTPVKGSVKSKLPFKGCLADATLNGVIINFANATEKRSPILGRCILEKDDSIEDVEDIDIDAEQPIWRPPPPVTTTEKYDEEAGKPSRGDGGFEEAEKSAEVTEPPTTIVPETTVVTTTTPQPIVVTKSTLPPVIDSCALPPVPAEDISFAQAGYRFGKSNLQK